ncbi:MAG: TetR/AcrR family transcriptional regulator [Actinobacteria bacterium]|nr:TetR/AcrR family transcriptional regulator [Actinomycetota bacterium]
MGERRERADASRNRGKILIAAEELFAAKGACNVSMDEVAAAAGVGKGTVYRRFSDQAGLAMALLEEKEKQLQDAVIRGPAPLGPGGPPGDRLAAFVDALLDLLDAHTELHVLSETSSRGARYRSGLYAFYRLHVQLLLEQLDPDMDAEVMADIVLAPLDAELFQHLHTDRSVEVTRMRTSLQRMIRSFTTSTLRTQSPVLPTS